MNKAPLIHIVYRLSPNLVTEFSLCYYQSVDLLKLSLPNDSARSQTWILCYIEFLVKFSVGYYYHLVCQLEYLLFGEATASSDI